MFTNLVIQTKFNLWKSNKAFFADFFEPISIVNRVWYMLYIQNYFTTLLLVFYLINTFFSKQYNIVVKANGVILIC